jgi:hypothetical protein
VPISPDPTLSPQSMIFSPGGNKGGTTGLA